MTRDYADLKNMHCYFCGEMGRKYENYEIFLKMAGQEKPKRYDICYVCWSQKKMQRVVEEIYKALGL